MIISSRPWKIIPFSAAFVVAAFAASFWLLSSEQQAQYNAALARELDLHARLLRDVVHAHWPDLRAQPSAAILDTLRTEGLALVVLDKRGDVMLDSGQPVGQDALALMPEVLDALHTGRGAHRRAITVNGREHVIVARRIGSPANPLGVLWLARPSWSLVSDGHAMGRVLGISAGIIAALTGVLAYFLFRVRRRMLVRLVRGARRLSEGELHAELDIGGSDDLALLSSSLNVLRRRLLAQVETIDRQRRTLESLVNQLHEGVVVVRQDGRIALINPAAIKLLDIKVGPGGPAQLVGRPVETCVRQHALQRMLLVDEDDDRGARRRTPWAGDEPKPIEIEGPQRTAYVLADTSPLDLGEDDDELPPQGRALVLTDVTEMQRTIQLRTDFVANASHELRTPLSTIRAAVETLLSMDLSQEADAARQFLQAINRHSARLENMVSDLLDLSRLESPTKQFEPERLPVRMVLDDLRTRFAEPLDRKRIRWNAVAEPNDAGAIIVSGQLLRLAVDNLVDNAIKFTDAEGEISVRLQRSPGWVAVTVADTGCGIAPEEQQRVFERFYQVERGRSGVERGTGLGLSIVRHAVGAMRGQVSLDSQLGRGTSVTIHIPQPPPPGDPDSSDPVAQTHDSLLT